MSSTVGVSQNSITPCDDSIEFKKICPLIKTIVLERSFINFWETDELSKLINNDKNCILKNYATCFDCIFSLGLDLKKKFLKAHQEIQECI